MCISVKIKKNFENGEIGLCLWPGCGVCTPNENGENGENSENGYLWLGRGVCMTVKIVKMV